VPRPDSPGRVGRTAEFPTDPAVLDVLYEIIRQDAVRTDQPDLARVAREVLAGRLKVGEVPRYAAYAKVLSTGIDDYVRWRDGLSDAARAQHERSAFDYLASVHAEATLILSPRRQRPPNECAESA
jgi:hypothetical protein